MHQYQVRKLQTYILGSLDSTSLKTEDGHLVICNVPRPYKIHLSIKQAGQGHTWSEAYFEFETLPQVHKNSSWVSLLWASLLSALWVYICMPTDLPVLSFHCLLMSPCLCVFGWIIYFFGCSWSPFFSASSSFVSPVASIKLTFCFSSCLVLSVSCIWVLFWTELNWTNHIQRGDCLTNLYWNSTLLQVHEAQPWKSSRKKRFMHWIFYQMWKHCTTVYTECVLVQRNASPLNHLKGISDSC